MDEPSRRVRRCAAICAALLAFAAQPSRSADPFHPEQSPRDSPLDRYMQSDALLATLQRLSAAQDAKLQLATDCTGARDIRLTRITVIVAPDFGRPPNPTTGLWVTNYDVARCGSTQRYGAVFQADPNGGQPQAALYYPGFSRASPILVKDAMVVAGSTALRKAAAPACHDLQVADMEVTQPVHDRDAGANAPQVWAEDWTFLVCGQRTTVAMTFTTTPADGGTDFQAR